ncbi:MAG TPA: GRP family sugar transporter [Acidobacteriaceae bacterium]|nr:GRP family sugar transporter [Acidobacteriaceae bacterium]
MFVPTTFHAALLMTILSTVCWGSFANTFKGTRNYRFELYYWDYALGIFLVSLLLAFTMGSYRGGSSAFLSNLRAADGINLFYAALGGFIFNIANTLLVAGIEIVGLAVAFPVSIGIALVEGVALSYALQPRGNPALLAAGIAMAVLALILVGKSYGALRAGAEAVSRRGLVVCVISGLLMGIFAPFVTRAMTRGATLTPYTTAVCLTFGAFVCCFFFNTLLMRKPITGTPVAAADYFRAPASYHALGLLGGGIWGLGTVFNFVAASLVGVAISYAIGQASPMVACLWGVFAWKEFRGANAKAKGYLAAMFTAYLLALVLIARAYGS